MNRVVRIAPLAKLPPHASTFDYLWNISTEPRCGMVVRVSFRRQEIDGVVVAVDVRSAFKLKSVAEQQPASLLTPLDVSWIADVARRMDCSVGSLFIHMLPQLTKKTIVQCINVHASDSKKNVKSGKLQYAWYRTTHASQNALSAAIRNRSPHGPIAVIASTQELSLAYSVLLAEHPELQVKHLNPNSAPQRRAAWCAWVTAKPGTIVVGTHLACWLPHVASAAFIILESSHPAHEQWDGARCTNRQILESRRIHFNEDIVVVDHSPDTVDLARVTALPSLAAWPTIIDRTADEPTTRSRQWSPTLDEKISAAKRTLFFVPHLHTATHQVCRDCGKLFRVINTQPHAACSSCHSVKLVDVGLGGKKLASDLIALKLILSPTDICLLDLKTFNKNDSNYRDKKVSIATTPLFDKLPLGEFDLMIDVAADFELLHPEYDSEERLWKRLRATSVRLGAAWPGTWYAQTHHPELDAWRLAHNSGFTRWWQHEESLRKRFKQRPFTELDFGSEI